MFTVLTCLIAIVALFFSVSTIITNRRIRNNHIIVKRNIDIINKQIAMVGGDGDSIVGVAGLQYREFELQEVE